jgi:2-dehydropantoate 2-reductase
VDPVVIVGAGAIGGTIGAYLARAGVPVLLVDRNREHVEAMVARGLTIDAPKETFTQPVAALTPEALEGPVREVFLCTKALDTRAAVAALAPKLSPDGYVLSVQNGLNGPVIAEVVGPERTVGCFVNFSADLVAPGRIEYAGPATMAVGEFDGRQTARPERIRSLLAPLQPVIVTDNIEGYLWSKVAYGALLFATALTDATMAECVLHPRYQKVLVAIAREVVAVAERQGIRLVAFDGWDPAAVHDPTASRRMMDELAAVMRRNRKVRTGVWRDLAIHRRKTEVDAEYGPVLALARAGRVPTPLLAAMVDIVHDLEAGRAERGFHHLETLHRILAAHKEGAS